MQAQHNLDALTLHAFVDRQLDPEQERRVLAAMDDNAEIRDQVGRLRSAKDWMRTGFSDAEPRQKAPTPNTRCRRCGLGIAASLLAVIFTASGGLVGYFYGGYHPSQLAQATDQQHILLHLEESSPATFDTVLDYAEAFLTAHHASGAEVEVVANAGGIDLMRVGGSPYAERMQALTRRFANLHFIACANAIHNMRKQGIPVTVLDDVDAGETAVDHIVKRLRDGWSYVKVSDLPGA
jgi:intracellular sulfur oxidation DsrE/DsrF family protein